MIRDVSVTGTNQVQRQGRLRSFLNLVSSIVIYEYLLLLIIIRECNLIVKRTYKIRIHLRTFWGSTSLTDGVLVSLFHSGTLRLVKPDSPCRGDVTLIMTLKREDMFTLQITKNQMF